MSEFPEMFPRCSAKGELRWPIRELKMCQFTNARLESSVLADVDVGQWATCGAEPGFKLCWRESAKRSRRRVKKIYNRLPCGGIALLQR